MEKMPKCECGKRASLVFSYYDKCRILEYRLECLSCGKTGEKKPTKEEAIQNFQVSKIAA